MNRATLSTVFVLAALVATVVGCGGGGDESSDGSTESSGGQSSSSSSSSSTQAFVKEADAICADAQKRIETEFAAFLKKADIKELGEKGESKQETEAHSIEVIETVGIPQLRRQVNELRALEPPEDKEAEVEAYLDAVEDEIKAGEQDPRSLSGAGQKVFAKSDAAAKGIGFKICGAH